MPCEHHSNTFNAMAAAISDDWEIFSRRLLNGLDLTVEQVVAQEAAQLVRDVPGPSLFK